MLLPRSLFVVVEIFAAFPTIDWMSTLKPAVWDANGYLADFSMVPGYSREAFLDGLYLPNAGQSGYWIQQESTFWRRSLWQKAGTSIPDYDVAGTSPCGARFINAQRLSASTIRWLASAKSLGQRSTVASEKYRSEAAEALNRLRLKFGWRPAALIKRLPGEGEGEGQPSIPPIALLTQKSAPEVRNGVSSPIAFPSDPNESCPDVLETHLARSRDRGRKGLHADCT